MKFLFTNYVKHREFTSDSHQFWAAKYGPNHLFASLKLEFLLSKALSVDGPSHMLLATKRKMINTDFSFMDDDKYIFHRYR